MLNSRHFSRARMICLFRFSQVNQQQEKGYQRQNKKQWSAAVMNGRINHLWPDVDAKFAEDKYSETISNNRQRNDEQGQRDPFPWTAQKKITRQHAGDQQRHARMDSAAFWSHFQTDVGQLKDQSLAKIRSVGQYKK